MKFSEESLTALFFIAMPFLALLHPDTWQEPQMKSNTDSGLSHEVKLGAGIYFTDPQGYIINLRPTKTGISVFVQDTDFDTFKITQGGCNWIDLEVVPDFGEDASVLTIPEEDLR